MIGAARALDCSSAYIHLREPDKTRPKKYLFGGIGGHGGRDPKVFELGVVTKPGAEGREADGDVVVWNREATVPEHLQQGTPSQKVSVTLNSSRVDERDQALWHHIRFHRFHLRLFFPSFVCPALALALAFAFGVDDTGINRGKDKRKRGKRARECSECHLRLCSPSIPNPPKVVHFRPPDPGPSSSSDPTDAGKAACSEITGWRVVAVMPYPTDCYFVPHLLALGFT
ncbi:hypothetical protein BHM03_00000416 [Ensete ventricosum]|nr:hypothetical protein BHM03_00000416 [Ensete ventricosum]